MEKLIKRINFGHLMLILFIEGAVLWYFFDAYSASSNIQNIILIAPASILAIFLGLIVIYRIFRSALSRESEACQVPEAVQGPADTKHLFFKPLVFIVIFGLYIFFLDIIGFDIATYLFLGIIMAIQGERRIWLLVTYSLVFGTAVVWFFGLMIPYDMFTILVPN